jgi:hypothetical protein
MGQMRFLVSPPEKITQEMAHQAYLSGLDRVSWKARARADAGGLLTIQRAVSDSANLNLPWPVEGRGVLTLSSGTLRETPTPYLLPLELARGAVCQLREQLAEWEMLGLAAPDRVRLQTAEATRLLGHAAVGQQEDRDASTALAESAIVAALAAGDLLAAAYVEQSFAGRRAAARPAPCLAVDLNRSPPDALDEGAVLQAVNAVAVPLCWRDVAGTEGELDWSLCDRQIAWARSKGLKLLAGPLLSFDERRLPDWLPLWEDDFESIFSFASEFVEAAVKRYHGQVHVWHCAGRINAPEVLSLSEEEKLRLAARAIEIVSALDPDASILVSFDQPWAEYLSRRDTDYPPLHVADALVRVGLELHALGLEINLGLWPGGTLPRAVLEIGRQLDYWALLGLPLYVSITVPSSDADDRLADHPWKPTGGPWTPRAQQLFVARYLPLILAKPYVQGVVWGQLRDAERHEFPHAGLFDPHGKPKPALATLAAIRQRYLSPGEEDSPGAALGGT